MEIKVNGVNLHYEEYGQGSPIILLHGNHEDISIFDKLIDNLKRKYKVYAIDSRCHGKSENTNEISYDLMRDDIIAFIYELKLNKPIIYGFSDGAIIGIMIAIKSKDLLSRVISSGANVTPNGIGLYYTIMNKLFYLLTKDKVTKIMIDEPLITTDELNSITIPVNLIVGKKDAIKLKHTKYIKENIKNSTLEVLENEDHGSYIIHSDKIYEVIKKYLEEDK